MKPTARPSLRVLTLLGLAALLPAAPACREEAPTPAPAPAAPAQPAVSPEALFGRAEPPRAPTFTREVLGFEARNEGLPVGGTWIGYPLLHDFNGDGRADLVSSNREEDGYSAWESTPSGAWVRRIAGPPSDGGDGPGLPRDMQYGPAAAADADGDGHPDLFLSAHTNALRLYLNDGQMHWTAATQTYENPFLLLDIAVGNLNGDAFPDVAGIAHFEGGASLYLGDGHGGLRRLPESAAILPQRAMGKDVELADLDGDGTDDLVIGCNQGLKAILVRPGEPYRFEDVSAGLPVPSIGNTIYSARVARFAPGAWPQIAAAMVANPQDPPENRVYVGVWSWSADERRWLQIDKGLPREEAYRDLCVGDFDRDGNQDLLTISIQSGAVVWLGAGDGSFRAAGRLEGSYGKGRSALGDVDGDGWTDVVVAIPASKDNPEAGSLRCYRNKPELWKK